MKKLISTGFLFMVCMTYGQFQVGIRGGLNYGDKLEITDLKLENAKFTTENNIGFHVGVYTKIDLPMVYIMPEIVYTQLKSRSLKNGVEPQFDTKKIDIPISLGYKILPMLSVFAGPSLQYIIGTEYRNISIETLQNRTDIGYNVGIGFQISKIGFNIRYEGNLSPNTVSVFEKYTNVKIENIDMRSSQLIVSVTFRIN